MPHYQFLLFGMLAGVAAASMPVASHANDAHPSGFILAASDGVSVSDAWARATPAGASTGAAYLMLMGGGQADAVVGVSTPAAATAAVHQSASNKGVMTMRAVPSLPIPAGGMVMLEPGGYHVMLMGLTKPLVAGQTFPLTVRFEHSAPVTVDVTVRPVGGKAPAMDHMH
jgi:copper(I)-binding protein